MNFLAVAQSIMNLIGVFKVLNPILTFIYCVTLKVKKSSWFKSNSGLKTSLGKAFFRDNSLSRA